MFIILGILALSIIAFVHEFGHFLAAKLLGLSVEEFFIGLPGPKIFSFKIGETRYGVSWILFGGYVRIRGEFGEEGKEKGKSFYSQPTWKKSIIVLAGPFMNYLLAVLIFSFFLTHIYLFTTTIQEVLPNSVAEKAGIKPGDKVISIDGRKISEWSELVLLVRDKPNEEVSLEVLRGDKRMLFYLRLGEKEGHGFLGISPKVVEQKRSYPQALLYSFWMTAVSAFNMVKLLIYFISQGKLLKYAAGPVGGVAITAEVAKMGWEAYANIVAALSLIIGVVNLIPILPADGGRLLLHVFEGITRRRVKPERLAFLQALGFALFGALFIYLLFQDITRIYTGSLKELVP
jgi:regulator of sigma E protease